MTEQKKPTESATAKEHFSTADQRVALQARLMLGEAALNPDKTDLAKVEADQLTAIKKPVFNLISCASTSERQTFWEQQAAANEQLKSFDQQYLFWQQGLLTYVNQDGNSNVKQVLVKLTSAGVNWNNFTAQEAEKVYRRYFCSQPNSASHVQAFINDVVNSYNNDYQAIKADLPVIKQLANIFGGNSAEVLEAAIEAQLKINLPEKKQELIDQVNETKTIDQSPTLRINWLNPDEERLLRWLDQYGKFEHPQTIPTAPEVKMERQRLQQARQHQNELIEQKWKEINHYPAREIDLGQTPNGENIRIRLGIPDVLNEIERQRLEENKEVVLKYPNIPHVFIANQLLIENKDKTNANLANVCVISAHGIRFQNGRWKFLDGQPIYDTVNAFNDYARRNNLPQIEFITTCDNEAPNQLKIIGLNTGLGPIIQSHLKPTRGVMSFNQRKGEVYVVITGDFPEVESLASWKKEFEYEPVDQTSKPPEQKPIDIRIIDSSTQPVDSKLLQGISISDQPAIIEVTKLPEKKVIINLPQTAFDIVGNPSRFVRTNLTDKISASPLVPLPYLKTADEDFFYFTVARQNDNGSISYSNCFVAKKNGDYQPVGHIDYTTNLKHPDSGICHMSNLHETLTLIPQDKLPQYIKTFQSVFPNGVQGVAVETERPYRSQKLGKALWLFAQAQAEYDGLKEIEIVGDITVFNDPLGQARSFYQHLGARPQLYLQYDQGQDRVEGGKRLVASVFLDYSQISKIKELLEPIKIKIS